MNEVLTQYTSPEAVDHLTAIMTKWHNNIYMKAELLLCTVTLAYNISFSVFRSISTPLLQMVVEYPRVSKALRDMARQQAGEIVSEQRTHTCSFSAMQGTGHKDLDSLNNTPLMFELELLQVDQPGEYKKEHWAMTEAEKYSAIPKLKEDGNALYKEEKYLKASDKYFEALSYLEEMCIKEKPDSETWNGFTERKIPFLLNYAQCKLLLCEYAEVIRHTTSVLEFDGDNVKALFRRGKAHSGCWNVSEAREDLERVVQLDPSLSKTVEKELKSLSSRVREKELEERELLKGKLF